ncbi:MULTISPECIES: hypothetical protein [unclassified Endozoicomonas]|uniref:hypothetical protein n=1 Tax=unclassified Endozoicomonas TaxID=2644528 RepID=UPI002147DD2F|nr:MULTISPECIES: hypothetical protein [unclassified Endozoicomonas]
MSQADQHQQMLIRVATALGAELLQQMAFVGGCTTGLLLTDAFSLEQVRHTDDVDLIVHVMGHTSFSDLQAVLQQKGFSHSTEEDDPLCAMRLGDMRVDFMPDDASILGFSNRWYPDALSTSEQHVLSDNIIIRLVKPVYFIATKLEAYQGRGYGDPLASRDIEDLLNLFDGRPELINEISSARDELRQYISEEISQLMQHPDFEYAVQSCALGDSEREALIFERLDLVAEGIF